MASLAQPAQRDCVKCGAVQSAVRTHSKRTAPGYERFANAPLCINCVASCPSCWEQFTKDEIGRVNRFNPDLHQPGPHYVECIKGPDPDPLAQ